MDIETRAFREARRNQRMFLLTEAVKASDNGSDAQHLFAAARRHVANAPWETQ